MKECSTLDLADTIPPGAHVPSNIDVHRSLAKTAIVITLSWVLAWRPTLAMRLGKLGKLVWCGFRGA